MAERQRGAAVMSGAAGGRGVPPRTVPQDSVLPRLAEALDAATMRTVFENTLFVDETRNARPARPTKRFHIQRCEIEWVKYRPGKNCTVAYRLEMHDRVTKKEWDQLLCARVFARGQSPARFLAAQSQDLVDPEVGRPITHLPRVDMVVWAFPNDGELRALPKIVDPNCLRSELLPGVVKATFGRGWKIVDLSREIVAYIPEDACTVCVHLQLERRRGGERLAATVYGKTYKDGKGAETYRMMRRLWESEARREAQLRMAQPLKYDRALNILWQSGLSGTALLEQDITGPYSLSLFGKAAKVVAALHRADVSCSRAVTVSDLVSRLQEMKPLLPRVRPSCRRILDPLIGRLVGQAERLGDQPVAVLHGDLRLRHILIEGDHIGLIDLDALCHGSPWQDIGSFTAAILYKGRLMGLSDLVIQNILATFYAHYAHSVPWKMPRAALNWYTAVALINERAFRCITRLQSDKLQMLDDLIALASRISLGETNPGGGWGAVIPEASSAGGSAPG